MKYILDESAIYYMLESFPRRAVPKLFEKFSNDCECGNIVADKETQKSLEIILEEDTSFEWMNMHSSMFKSINQKEAKILGELVENKRFEFLLNSRAFSRNLPISIPFIIAIAKNEGRVIVMDKKAKDCTAVFNICEKEGVRFIYIDEYLSEIVD